MQKTLFNHSSFLLPIQNRLNQALVAAVAIGIAVAGTLPALANPIQAQLGKDAKPIPQLQATNRLVAAAKGPNASLPDGTYLYGQSPKPGQVGKGYFVFEVNRGRVVGALYMPRSSFDCASGNFAGEQLALTVVNSYDRSTNPFEIAVSRSSTVASTKPEGDRIGLQGFHRISTISQNDYRILNVCKADLNQNKQAQK